MSKHILTGGPRILLVEDHPFQLIGMEVLLNRLGFFKLMPVLDCAEALAAIKSSSRYDLLLCDQHLPDGCGIELIEKAYELGGISHAIIISGVECPRTLHRAATAQGIPLLACLSKPFTPKEFLRALEPLWLGGSVSQPHT